MPKAHTIEEVLNSLNPEQKETVQNLRRLVREAVPEASEMLRQGQFVYRLQDRDFVWLTVTQGHVDLEFAMGASLSSNLLKSRGVAEKNPNVRHVEVDNFALVQSELKRLVHEAASVGFEHCTTT